MTTTLSPDRTAWREAVADIAEKAKATLPECNGRVEKAVVLVLAGDVELFLMAMPRSLARAMAPRTTASSTGRAIVRTLPRLLQGGVRIGSRRASTSVLRHGSRPRWPV